jgi:hypothetical protein
MRVRIEAEVRCAPEAVLLGKTGMAKLLPDFAHGVSCSARSFLAARSLNPDSTIALFDDGSTFSAFRRNA